MWNLRLATMFEQNENKNGDGFVFSFFSDMEDGDQEIIVNGFYTARARRQIYRLYCPSGDSVSLDEEGSNFYQEMQEQTSDTHRQQWMESKLVSPDRLRSQTFYTVVMQMYIVSGEVPRHNFSSNLAIITQSENNVYAQENIRVREQLQGTRGVSLVFNNNGRLAWSHTRPPMSQSVTSFREASSFRRLWESDENGSSSFLYSLILRDWDPAKEEEVSHDGVQPHGPHAAAEHEEDLDTYSFDLYSSSGIESVQWSLSRLRFELLRRNVAVTMKKLQNLVNGRSRCSRGVQCNARKMAVHLIGSDGRALNRIVLPIKNRSEGTD
eukprot:jgi/Picre1/33658/NNA_001138.t1